MSKKNLQNIVFVLTLAMMTLFFANSYSQSSTEYNLFSLSDNSSLLNTSELKDAASNSLIFNINKEELKILCEKRSPQIVLNIPFLGNHNVKLNLQRFDVLAPNAKIVARTANGNEEVQVNDLAVSYTGHLEGAPNTLAVISFSSNNVTGMLSTENDNIILGSLKDRAGHETDNYILYRESDLKVKNTLHCETEENISSSDIEKMRKVIIERMNNSSPTDLLIAEIAIEIDNITYNIYGGSIPNTTNYALTIMTAVSAIYMKEENVKLIVPYLRIWTTADPYTGTTSLDLLNQFRGEWNANQQSVTRTVAHFMTKRTANLGGIAWVNTLCSNPGSGYGYAFSNTIGGQSAQLPNFSYEVEVVAHELGHNFGSLHTFNCSWVGGPIDTCYAVEGGCYSGPTHSAVGTIMSYCYNNGSVSFVLGFGPQPRAVIRNGADAASCMYVSQRPLYVGFPNGGETYRTGSSTPIYWGTSLTGNVNIELSSNNGTSWTTIQNNVLASQRTYDWTIPYMATALQSKLRIINSANPNEGDTTDASFKIILNLSVFNNLTPPALTRVDVSSASTGTQRFVWQRAGTDPSIRYKFKIRKLATTTDYVIASDNGGQDSGVTLRKSYLDTLAQILGTTGDSVRCTWRGWAYNGYDSSAANGSFLVTLVRTSVGINVISTTVPDKFILENNYPNPFNPSTNIKFDIAKSTFADLTIYDSRGREIKTLVNENLNAGSYEYSFDASNLPSGAYFYRLKTSEFTDTKRMILLK